MPPITLYRGVLDYRKPTVSGHVLTAEHDERGVDVHGGVLLRGCAHTRKIRSTIGVSPSTSGPAKKGARRAMKMGRTSLVRATGLAAYGTQRKGVRRFTREDYPLHGKLGLGHRRKK